MSLADPNAATYDPETNSLSGQSTSSGTSTAVVSQDQDAEPKDDDEDDHYAILARGNLTPRLPNIDIGEPLLWEEKTGHSQGSDPFLDGSNHAPSSPRISHTAPSIRFSSVPPPQSPKLVNSSLAPSIRYPSVPPPTTSHLTGLTHLGGTDNTTRYSSIPTQPSTPFRRSPAKGTTPTGSPLDHFRYDVEAYASGINSRASFQPPLSRSPTPMREENSFDAGHQSTIPAQWTGYETAYSHDPEADYEKAALVLQQKYANKPQSTGPAVLHVVPELPYEDDESSLADSDAASQLTKPSFKSEKSHTTWRSSTEPATPLPSTKHFGPAPTGRITRRLNKVKKKIALTKGNLVVELDVPPKLLLPLGRQNEPEMQRTRYTAVTCDPDDFEKRGFFLRQNEYGRQTELFIVITMYNVGTCIVSWLMICLIPIEQEDEILFTRTLYGVMQNISHLCTRKNSRTWGPESWKKVI
jgi:chitin synthase